MNAFPRSDTAAPSAASAELDRILEGGLVHTSFQPIFDLDSMSVVAYGTSTRGPQGSLLESPDALSTAAAEADRVIEFDTVSRTEAILTSERSGLSAPRSLFFSAAPSTVTRLADDETALAHPMVLEIAGHTLVDADLVPLLQAIVRIRDQGWAIAMTEVGVDPHTLALLPAVAPDVICLDLQIISDLPDQRLASVLSGVSAYAEATGCLVLAHGVETEQQVLTARALGATLAQGPLYGCPDKLPDTLPYLSGVRPAPSGRLAGLRQDTPFSVAAERREAHVSNRGLLLQISLFLEARAAAEDDAALVFGTFQHRDNFDDWAVERYFPLGLTAAFVGVFGHRFSELGLTGSVCGVDLDEADPLVAEWNVVVISPNFAATLTARQLGEPSPTNDTYEFILTHDRRLTIEAARTLVARL
ncbi:EAL domain-containing protein [Agreia pratensis]|uniref:EAL domain, c-di-GMP-specific phosphodiesterase class I (Or its enzymatically inactive variant) n=1 Tax=Agreia pratensis TaxID=150121 RepID=A0A1X7JE70_9MICO|nr:EAL domain-containing protein [Agreia pratensis]MBF4635043.1 EAL domain-containing protein [Agreia pratensis]SMG26325.1 EAL domain, c-di-GMP-specific phosphodiesterase class I (or its enzymatically inactive variant) [Agreia pratensis]